MRGGVKAHRTKPVDSLNKAQDTAKSRRAHSGETYLFIKAQHGALGPKQHVESIVATPPITEHYIS